METTLKVQHRTETGKGAAHKLRAAGRVPGVIYGQGMDPAPVSVASQDVCCTCSTPRTVPRCSSSSTWKGRRTWRSRGDRA